MDENPRKPDVPDDEYARRSFTFRRPGPTQLQILSFALAVLLVAAIVWLVV